MIGAGAWLLIASSFAQEAATLDLVIPVLEATPQGSADVTRVGDVRAAASVEVARQQERVLRWDLVSISKASAVVDRKTGEVQQRIRFSLFPGVVFVAEHTRHVLRDWSINWYGTIVQGGTGTVHIKVVPDENNRPVAFVNVRSDSGDFNVWPTAGEPGYAVVAESNKWLQEKLD